MDTKYRKKNREKDLWPIFNNSAQGKPIRGTQNSETGHVCRQRFRIDRYHQYCQWRIYSSQTGTGIKTRTTTMKAYTQSKRDLRHPKKTIMSISLARGQWFLSTNASDISAARSKLRDQTALLRMTRSRNCLANIRNHLDSEQVFLTKLMQAVPDEVCDNTQKLRSMSCNELIRATNPANSIKSAATLAAADLITRFYLQQLYSRNDTQMWQGIVINEMEGIENDLTILTTDTVRNLSSSDKLKHLWELASAKSTARNNHRNEQTAVKLTGMASATPRGGNGYRYLETNKKQQTDITRNALGTKGNDHQPWRHILKHVGVLITTRRDQIRCNTNTGNVNNGPGNWTKITTRVEVQNKPSRVQQSCPQHKIWRHYNPIICQSCSSHQRKRTLQARPKT